MTTESTAQRAADSPRVQRAARWGLATRGVLYLVVGVLVVELAFGRRVEPNSQGALRAVAHQPLGTALLALVAVGLAAHACWQGLLAVAGPDGAGDARRAAVARVANVGRALLYAALAVIAVQLVAGANPTASSTREQEDWTGHVLRWPGGRALVVIVGLAVVVGGVVVTWRGFDGRFRRDLHLDEMSIPMRRVVSALAKAGIAARGVVAALVGVFVVEAAVRFDPADSSGIDGALARLRNARYGPVLLVIVAAGLAAYGLYTFALARYGDVTRS
ncbi:MAG TPA: DUF1206 domain-containing protein [Acidimicrobiia bacterium]|nr:DUF1206 domain-containing protein [Acidimicrobiia bacterium]